MKSYDKVLRAGKVTRFWESPWDVFSLGYLFHDSDKLIVGDAEDLILWTIKNIYNILLLEEIVFYLFNQLQ